MFEEFLGMRKLHGFALDDDEVNAFDRLVEQFRPARDLSIVPSRRSNSVIEGFQRLEGSDHLSARCEVVRGCFLPDFNRQRIIWVIERHISYVHGPPVHGEGGQTEEKEEAGHIGDGGDHDAGSQSGIDAQGF
jgi:hypothetical protein